MEKRKRTERNQQSGLIPFLVRAGRRENGFALPVALIVLLVITFLGMSAITFTNLDVDVSRNVRVGESVFYTADACLILARGVLSKTHLATGWDAKLTGVNTTNDEIPAASDVDASTGVLKNTITTNTAAHLPAPNIPPNRPPRGAVLNDLNGVEIRNYPLGSGFCTVYVRNNREDLKATKYTDDTDDTVVVTAIGVSSTGAKDTIEAAINWKILTGIPYPDIADYPQMTMGPQNLNAARANLDMI
jgi:hypothetical protein